MIAQLPVPKLPPKLIVLRAFGRSEESDLVPAWDAREMPDERRALLQAKALCAPTRWGHLLVSHSAIRVLARLASALGIRPQDLLAE